MVFERPKHPRSISLVTTAGVLGGIQGLVWTVLSVTSLVYYHIGVKEESSSQLGISISNLYLNKKVEFSGIIGPDEFSYFMYVYLVLSFAWLVISCLVLWAALSGKGDKFYDGTICGWIIDASLLALLDLILLIFIASDYNELLGSEVNTFDNRVAIGVVMTLAARGFVLWILNVIFITILTKYLVQRRNKAAARDRSVIDAYSSRSRLPPWSVPTMYQEPSGTENKGFQDDTDTLPYPSSTTPPYQFMEDRYPNNDSNKKKTEEYQQPSNTYQFIEEKYPRNDNSKKKGKEMGNVNSREFPLVILTQPNNTTSNSDNYWKNKNQNRDGDRPRYQDPLNPYGQPAAIRTAKIGRQGGQRSPPLNLASPYIPDPDYSPPSSRKVRGVLRPKSNYVFI